MPAYRVTIEEVRTYVDNDNRPRTDYTDVYRQTAEDVDIPTIAKVVNSPHPKIVVDIPD